MRIIEREMQSRISDTKIYNGLCQAGINSEGNITLRNYDPRDKDKDEIIILSDYETEAIFNLIRILKKRDMLPFWGVEE